MAHVSNTQEIDQSNFRYVPKLDKVLLSTPGQVTVISNLFRFYYKREKVDTKKEKKKVFNPHRLKL